MARCKYPDSVCTNMTLLHGMAYCDSVPCSLRDELPKSTNADRVRAMSDEELAELIVSIKDCYHCPIGTVGKQCHEICDTPENLLDWLQQPAPEEGAQL